MTKFVQFAWGPASTPAAGADALSPLQGSCRVGNARPARGPRPLFTIPFVLEDDPEDDFDDDDEFGEDEEGEDEEDEENDDEDPETETWQVSLAIRFR